MANPFDAINKEAVRNSAISRNLPPAVPSERDYARVSKKHPEMVVCGAFECRGIVALIDRAGGADHLTLAPEYLFLDGWHQLPPHTQKRSHQRKAKDTLGHRSNAPAEWVKDGWWDGTPKRIIPGPLPIRVECPECHRPRCLESAHLGGVRDWPGESWSYT